MMTVRRTGTRLLALTLAAASITCGDDLAAPDPGDLPRLVVTIQPSSVAENAVPLVRQPVVRINDGSDQHGGAGIPVTASVEGATLGGTTTVETDENGVALFTDLVLSGPAGNYTLTFTAPSIGPVASSTIALSATAEVRKLVITSQPSTSANSGVPLTPQPVVRVETEAGQPLGAGIPVTVSGAGVTLAGRTTVESNSAGLAEFTDLALIGSGGTYKLTFVAPGAPAIASNDVTLSSASAERGQWSQLFDWPIVSVHTILLPTGRVLSIGRVGTPQVWDPATGGFTPVPAPAHLFCAGHALLSDGRVLVVGGHIKDGHGLPNLTLFSDDRVWTSLTPMARGRWYPTATTMGNGDVVITGGTDEDRINVTTPEVWSNGSVRQLTGAQQALPWYPRAFAAPDGSLFVAGPSRQTRFLSVSGAGSWRAGPAHLHPEARTYGSAVMYDDGKILYAGGAFTTNTAEIIDLNQANPVWNYTSPMAFARRHLNLTVLPTGEVLATGGVAGTTFNDISTGVHAAELWNPQTGTWATLASNTITRGYHGSSLLLPDGRVLNNGGGDGAGAPDQRNAELFSPPYLLRGARPIISSAPQEIQYGSQFRIVTAEAPAIRKISLIRLGAVTHAFDENQRFQWLSFTADATGLTVTAPSSSNRAPPGHYMVFILNEDDVPSVAKIVRIF